MIDYQANHTYVNPLYPVHIVSGSAGCSEELEWFDHVNFPAWSVVRAGAYGFGHLKVVNASFLEWSQLIDESYENQDTLVITRQPHLGRGEKVTTF